MTDLEIRSLVKKAASCDTHAETALFDCFVVQLTRFAQGRLSRRFSRRVDVDDIVQSAYFAFFGFVRRGRYEFHTSRDVWRLLAVLAIRSIRRHAQWHTAHKRSIYGEQNAAEYEGGPQSSAGSIASVQSPDLVAAVRDELSDLFAVRPAIHRSIVELRLSGEPVSTIAQTLTCCQRTVYRALAQFKLDLNERFAICPSSRRHPPSTTFLLSSETTLTAQR
jgi:DNA-directed RNA polymerase specialized sigma24 family protein